MQYTYIRTSAKKINCGSRNSPQQKQKNNSYLIGSKIGDFSYRNQTTCSKELDIKKINNPTDNTQYIRNLYKKYLGKQNINNSDRKIKTDMKDTKADRILAADACRQKLIYEYDQPQFTKLQSTVQNIFQQPNILRKLSNKQSKYDKINYNYYQIQSCDIINMTRFYQKTIDNQILNIIGNQRSSLVLTIQTINGIRKKYR